MGFLYYNEVDKASQKYYPDWDGAKPNLETFLNALNLSQPIIGSQFELIYSRWPRTKFFAKNISVPGISTNTIEINHAGFTISIPTHVKYDSTELTMTIIADKEGYHYYDWRNMVLQSGHPLIAGDPRSMIGKTESDTNEDYLDVRLRNKTNDRTHHHWTIHNFRPIGIGEIELSHDSSSFVEFEITGTFTHVTYMTGDDKTSNEKAQAAIKQQEQMKSNEENQPSNDDVKVEFTDGTTPDDIGQPDTQPEEEQPEPNPDQDRINQIKAFVNSNSLQTETNKEVVDGEVTTIIKKRGAISPEELNAMREASEQNTDDINTAKNELDNYANEVKQNTPSTEQLVEHKSSTSLKIDLNDLSSPEKIEAAQNILSKFKTYSDDDIKKADIITRQLMKNWNDRMSSAANKINQAKQNGSSRGRIEQFDGYSIETTESDELDSNLNLLITALRFNHNISGDINNLYVKDAEHEIEVYQKLSTEENRKLLMDAIKFNHNIPEDDDIGNLYIEDPEHEIEVYQKLIKFENS